MTVQKIEKVMKNSEEVRKLGVKGLDPLPTVGRPT